MSITAMKQALEAMLIKQQVTMWAQDGDRAKFNQAITALRQAIEQAEQQEPVAWRWKGLTAKERTELWWDIDMNGQPEHTYGKAIEAKLKEKNHG